MPDDPAPANSSDLLIATRNIHKVEEFRAILGPSFNIFDLTMVPNIPPVQETGNTFEENATLKALEASRWFEGFVIADDSGLIVDALGGLPGVRSARYAGENATDAENNTLLLNALAKTCDDKRSARFCCCIVVAQQGKKLSIFHGIVEGAITRSLKGKGGFGYDPLFIPKGYHETFGELSPHTKNTLSHRARALEQLKRWITLQKNH